MAVLLAQAGHIVLLPEYLTRRALPLPKKSIYLSHRCCTTTDGNWWVKLNTGTWTRIGDDKIAALVVKQNWMGGTDRINQDDIDKFMRDPPAVRGVMAVPTSQAPCVGFKGELNSDRYKRDCWLSATDYLDDYNRFLPASEQITARAFGAVLSGLNTSGHIERKQLGVSQRSLYLISNEKFPSDSARPGRGGRSAVPPFTVVPGSKAAADGANA